MKFSEDYCDFLGPKTRKILKKSIDFEKIATKSAASNELMKNAAELNKNLIKEMCYEKKRNH